MIQIGMKIALSHLRFLDRDGDSSQSPQIHIEMEIALSHLRFLDRDRDSCQSPQMI